MGFRDNFFCTPFSLLSLSHASILVCCYKASSGNSVAGGLGGPHVMQNRSMPRPVPVVGMQRMQPPPGIPAYNLASQAGLGGGVNPGGIPMQRGVAAQPHQQQQVFYVRKPLNVF